MDTMHGNYFGDIFKPRTIRLKIRIKKCQKSNQKYTQSNPRKKKKINHYKSK